MNSENSPPADVSLQSARFRTASLLGWIICAAVGAGISLRALLRAKYSGADSWSPMSHALDVVHTAGGGMLYRALFFTGHIKFQYPPGSLLILDLARHVGLTTIPQYNFINACILIVNAAFFSVFVVRIIGSVRWRSLQLPLGPLAYIVALRFIPTIWLSRLGKYS